MTKILFLLLTVLLLAQSCGKMLCRDDDLTIVRTDNVSNKLRLDGYYYGDISGINADSPEIYLLYQNGIFFNANSQDLSNAETGNVELDYSDLRIKYKSYWGVYKIESNNIEIEYWVPRLNGCVGLSYEKGIILNDTTFKITYWKHSIGNDTQQEKNVETIFKFHKYFPKPDSTVVFIQ